MRIPRELLRETASVEDYGGAGAHGPLFAAPRSMRASIQPTSKLVGDAQGATVAVDVLVMIRPEDGPVRPESRVTTRGVVYRVAQAYAMPDERRPSYFELALTRYDVSEAWPGGSGS
jgi:hypothetical protein